LPEFDCDVVVIGAGAAGLSALRELTRAGLKTICLEARDRIGGRIFTVHDPLAPVPIELGAEFIHGRPPEIWDIAKSAGLTLYDCFERAVHLRNGEPQEREDAWLLADRVLEDMQQVAEQGPDQSFADFLEQSTHPEEGKLLASAYVEGFNAARKEVIGIASLAQDSKAADEIGGDSSYRLMNGYDSVAKFLAAGVEDFHSTMRLNAVVDRVEWKAGSATVTFRSAIADHAESLMARRVVITIPLGVLQAQSGDPGRIEFKPEPTELLAAARKLRFGAVMRVIFRFGEPFWDENEDLKDIGFLLSQEQFFPTWWTALPVRTPVIVGWSAGPRAEKLIGKSRQEILACALRDLGRVTGVPLERVTGALQTASFHDWSADPFARGAYSYVPSGALPARERLAQPVADTLFFAGEATELNGHSATVHGAIASGRRVAEQILLAQAKA
jgi:monoamine oxidase